MPSMLRAEQAKPSSSQASSVLAQALEKNLAAQRSWRRLLHFSRESESSAQHGKILSQGFYLAPSGNTDPEAELRATLEAYFQPWPEDPNQHARCRFPARYFWLSQQLALPEYQWREPRCQKLEKWALFDRVQSVSLVMVSGYFGNPASTFGHALLRFNTAPPGDSAALFDLTINYGASVPANENGVLYSMRGLMGGYLAGYSDKYYYTSDLVYARTQFRDAWDYRLSLSEKERTFLLLHMWEVVGLEFAYYFLDENCALRLAEALDVVLDTELADNGLAWYIPVETFFRLQDAERERIKRGEAALISSIHFIPSSQRALYYQLAQLQGPQLELVNSAIREGVEDKKQQIADLPAAQQAEVLDALLEYSEYQRVAAGQDFSAQQEAEKHKILLKRMQLPAATQPRPAVPTLPAPTAGTAPMTMAASLASTQHAGEFLRLSWAPFKQELVGQNSLQGGEFIVFDLAAGLFEEEQKLLFDQLELVKAIKLNTLPVALEGETRWSWDARLAVDRVQDGEQDAYDATGTFGGGRAVAFGSHLVSYLMLDAEAHSQDNYVRLQPNIGQLFDFGKFKAWGYIGYESQDLVEEPGSISFEASWGGKLQYQLDPQFSLFAAADNRLMTRFQLGVNWYF